MEEKRGISIDELLKAVPDGVVITPSLKKVYNLAKNQARSCQIGKMVDDLVMLGGDIEETVNNMAHAARSETITNKEYDDFLEKIEEFQWSTIPKEIKEILVSSCGCKIA